MFSCLQNFSISQNGFDIVKNRIWSLLSSALEMPHFGQGIGKDGRLDFSFLYQILFQKLQTLYHFVIPPRLICDINPEIFLVCWVMLILILLFNSNSVCSFRQKVCVPVFFVCEQFLIRHVHENLLHQSGKVRLSQTFKIRRAKKNQQE